MQTMRWTNPALPQTLQIGVILLYIDAFFGALNALAIGGIGTLIYLAAAGLAGGAGWGIANEKKPWYWVGIVVSGLVLIVPTLAVLADPTRLFNVLFLISIIFPVAQFIALVHPMSRNYVKVWFS